MAERKQEPSFTVTDRRLFTSEGELRTDVTDETEKPKPPQAGPVPGPIAPLAKLGSVRQASC